MKRILVNLFLFVLIFGGFLATLNIFRQAFDLTGSYKLYVVLFVILYFLIWACVPLAEGLQRRERVQIFKEIAEKYGLLHKFTKIKYLNPYGEFNVLSGTYKGHNIEIKDIHKEPRALDGLASQIPARGVALKYGPQQTIYSVDGNANRFPQELKTFSSIFNAKYGYALKAQIVSMLEDLN